MRVTIPRTRAISVLAGVLALLATAPSASQAAQWIPSVPLPGTADAAFGADAAAAPDGTVIAVWTRLEAGKPRVVASVRRPGGSFSAPEPVSGPDARRPDIAMDAQGRATVVWQERVPTTARSTIQQSTRGPGGDFSPPQKLSNDQEVSEDPVVAVNSAGTTIVAWVRTKVGPFFPVIEAAARPGNEFGPSKQLSPDLAVSMSEPQVAVGEDGTGMVAWTHEGGTAEAARWTTAAGFGTSFEIAASDDFVSAPDVAIDGQGTAVFAYHAIKGGSRGVRVQTRTAGGSTSESVLLATVPGPSGTFPDLVADRAGNMLLTWEERPAGTWTQRAATKLNGKAFSGITTLATGLPFGSLRSAGISPAGDAVVAWTASGAKIQAVIKPRGAASFGPVQDDFPTRASITNVAAFADSRGNLGAMWRQTGPGDPGSIELRAFDGEAPVPTGIVTPSDAIAGRPASLSANFSDTWSPVSVNWALGDGADAAGAGVEHAYAAPGAFTATATALDGAGNAASQSGEVLVRGLRPDEIDGDGDGFSAAQDCNDGNPAIRPGAPEIRGNAIDENCDRLSEPFPRLSVTATIAGFNGPRFTRMVGVRVAGLEGGETVKLSCKGRGCRKRMAKTVRVKRKVALLKLDRFVRGARLRIGSQLEARITRPGFIGRVIRFRIQPNKPSKRTELCLMPGARRPGKC